MNSRTYFLDGSKRTKGSIGDFDIQLNTNDAFFTTQSNEKLYVSPTNFTQLNDFYNVDNSNNRVGFYVNTVLNPSATPLDGVLFTTPEGYYNAYSIQDYINNNLATTLADGIGDVGGNNFTFVVDCEYQNDTNIFSIKITSPNNFFNTYNLFMTFEDKTTATGDLYVSNQSLYRVLGFNETTTYGWSAAVDTLTSINTMDILLHDQIYIHTNFVSNNFENTVNEMIQSDLFFMVQNNVEKNALLTFENPNKLYYSRMVSNLNSLQFRLLDKNNNPIRFKTYPKITLTIEKINTFENTDTKKIETLNKILKVVELGVLYNSLKS